MTVENQNQSNRTFSFDSHSKTVLIPFAPPAIVAAYIWRRLALMDGILIIRDAQIIVWAALAEFTAAWPDKNSAKDRIALGPIMNDKFFH